MIRVYFASALHHAPKWRQLCAKSTEIIAHARWLKHSTLGTPDTPDHAKEFWLEDEQDVRDADAVVVFAQGDDRLRGALIETGIALACQIPVFVIGDHQEYGTWKYHPGVTIVSDFDDLFEQIVWLKPRYQRIEPA
jgi:nucleoside 2-deoxyribosyltransferase